MMMNQHVCEVVFLSTTDASGTIATGLIHRPQEWPGPNEEDVFLLPNWTVPCTIGFVLCPHQQYQITMQAGELQ